MVQSDIIHFAKGRGQTVDALEKGTSHRGSERKRVFALMKEIMDSNADEV